MVLLSYFLLFPLNSKSPENYVLFHAFGVYPNPTIFTPMRDFFNTSLLSGLTIWAYSSKNDQGRLPKRLNTFHGWPWSLGLGVNGVPAIVGLSPFWGLFALPGLPLPSSVELGISGMKSLCWRLRDKAILMGRQRVEIWCYFSGRGAHNASI